MPGNRRHIPESVKLEVLHLRETKSASPYEVRQKTGVSERTQSRLRTLYKETGQVVKENHGRPRKLTKSQIAFVETCLEMNPYMYLSELQAKLESVFGVRASIATLSRTVHRSGFTRKRNFEIEDDVQGAQGMFDARGGGGRGASPASSGETSSDADNE